MIAGLAEIAELVGKPAGAFLAEVDVVVHGTTVTTNAVLTHTGARTALRDHQGLPGRAGPPRRHQGGALRQPAIAAATPGAAPAATAGAPSASDRTGREVERLDEEELRSVAATLEREEIEAVAVSFMHSPSNPAHEQRALELLRELLPARTSRVRGAPAPDPRTTRGPRRPC